MASTVTRSCALFIAIAILSVSSARAQNARPEPLSGQEARILPLLAQLADQAAAADDLAFATRAQSQIAAILWPHDRERARAIFRRAFDSLSATAPTSGGVKSAASQPLRHRLTLTQKGQLRIELLNQIAGRDPELAEEFARALAYSIDEDWKGDRTSLPPPHQMRGGPAHPEDGSMGNSALAGKGDEERRELLISVALQIAERDPYRAMTLGQLSLGSDVSERIQAGQGVSIISPHFARLLMLMRAADAGLADLLFASALARLERQPAAPLADIHTLGSYLVSIANTPSGHRVNKAMIARFLHFAFDQMMRQSLRSGAGASGAAPTDSELESAAYFIGRQLDHLFARYLPDKLARLQRRIAEVNRVGAADKVIDPVPSPPTDPAEVAREARAAEGKESDALYARAALGWLARGELNEAYKTASDIANASVRDRVLVQIARRQAAEGRLNDAIAVARKMEDRVERAGAFVILAGAALAVKDRVCAAGLLSEAEKDAAGSDTTVARAQALFTIARAFADFDTLRAFEVTQTAIKAINEFSEAAAQEKTSAPNSAMAQAGRESVETSGPNFESTLSALARADFERALALAQQLSPKETSIAAQLAVCKGGLSAAPSRKNPAGARGADADAPL